MTKKKPDFISLGNGQYVEREIADWFGDDITWCSRKCPNKECFRNQANRKLKKGLISVGDMYKEGKCPKEAKNE